MEKINLTEFLEQTVGIKIDQITALKNREFFKKDNINIKNKK